MGAPRRRRCTDTQGVVMIDKGLFDGTGIARPTRGAIRKALACSAGLAALSLPLAAAAQIAPSVPTREEIQRPTLPPAAPRAASV